MKSFLLPFILGLLLLVGCGGEEVLPTEVPVAQLPTSLPTAQLPTATSTALPPAITPTAVLPVPASELLEVTDTPHLPIDIPVLIPTAAKLPIVRPTSTAVALDPSLPMPTGRIYFLWDPNPIPEVRGIGELSETSLYEAISGDIPNDWGIQPVVKMFGKPMVIPAPDSSKLGILRYDDTNGDDFVDTQRNTDTTRIYSYHTLDGTLTQLVGGYYYPLTFSWSPDSSALIYPHYSEVLLTYLNISTAEDRLIATLPDRVTKLSWAPLGELVAINRFPGDVDILDMETGTITSIVTETSYVSDMQWSQNGEWLSIPPAYNRDFSLIDIETLESIELVYSANFGFSAWSPHEQSLAFTHGEVDLSLWDANSREIRTLASMDALSRPSWSPSGDKLVVGFSEGEQSGLLFVNPVNGSQRKLDMGMFADQPIWSPDGEWLLFFSGMDGRAGLYMVHEEGSIPFLFLETTGGWDPYDIYWLPE